MSFENFGFIIASCLRHDDHFLSLKSCISSIQNFHPDKKIVVIVDYSSNDDIVKKCKNMYQDIIYETYEEEIPADMLFFKFFKQNKYFEKAILLQDSMKIKNSMDASKISDIKYIWHFTNHRVHWSTINEPETTENKINNIITHDDLNMYIINNLIKKNDFKDYCKKIYFHKNEWCGCFGTCSIITYDFVNILDDKTDIIDLQKKMTNNRLRRAIESIFSLAVQFVTKRKMEDSYDGLYYDGVKHNNFEGHYISKKSFDRQ